MKQLGKLCLALLLCIGFFFQFPWDASHAALWSSSSPAPSYEKFFAEKLTDGKEERVFTIKGVSAEKSLDKNIKCLFYPSSTSNTLCDENWVAGGFLWDVMRYFAMVLVFVYIVYEAINILVNKKDDLKEAFTSLGYVFLGATILFTATWLFGDIFVIDTLNETEGVVKNLTESKGIFFFILSFLKAAAFLLAIVMIVVTGFKMINPSSGEGGKGKELAKGLLNIIFAMLWIKTIDFIYYIAQQEKFAEEAGKFIIRITTTLGYVGGALTTLMVLYSGFLLLTDGGQGEKFKKAKGILINIVLAMICFFLFMFVIYQIFSEFNPS